MGFIVSGDNATCSTCGGPGERTGEFWACRACQPQMFVVRPGLGDMVASGLSRVGITKARAQAVAKAVGFEDCGCDERQRLANLLGARYLGLPPGSTASAKNSH